MSKNSKDIDKQKTRKDQLKTRYESDLHEYMVNNIENINRDISTADAARKAGLINELRGYYEASGMSYEDAKNKARGLNNQDLGKELAKARAEKIFKADYDNNVKACEVEISRLQQDSIGGNADLVMDLFNNYAKNNGDFGDAINDEFNKKLKENLGKINGAQATNINAAINSALGNTGTAVRDYVGSGAADISIKDVQNIVNSMYSKSGGSLSGAQLDAVNQLMEAVKKSDDKTHASVSVVPINTATEAKKDGGK